MSNTEMIDIASAAFARRLANLLRDRRETRGATMRELARRSGGAFTARQLRAFEEGRAELHEQVVCEVAALYQAELSDILPSRLPLRISDPGREGAAVISTSGISAPFDPSNHDSLLVTYLLLVRQLRAQQREPIIDLRREDVEAIADYLGEPGPTVMERLSTLMGATQLQRRAMAGMFIAGAIVVGLAGSGVAALGAGGSDTAPRASTTTVAVTVSVTPDSLVGGDTTPGVTLTRATAERARPRDEPLAGAPGMFAAPAPIAVSAVVDLTVVAPAAPPLPATPATATPPAASGATIETASTATPPTPSPGPTRAPAGPAPATSVGADPAGGIATSPVTSLADPVIASVIAPPLPPSSASEAGPEPELTIPDLPYDLPTTTPTTRVPTPDTTSPAATTPGTTTATTVPTTTPATSTPVTSTPATSTPVTTAPPTTTPVTTAPPPTTRDTTPTPSDESAVDAAGPPPVPNAATGQPPVPPIDGPPQEG